jgi:PAS domain S-box-containing protein
LPQAVADRTHLDNLGRQVLECLPSGILVVDITSRVLFINAEGERIFEVGREGFVGSMLVGHARFRPLISSINQFRQRTPSLSQSRQQFEGSIVRADGRVLPLGFSISNLVNSRRRVLGYVIIFRDLSDVARLRERSRHSELMAALGTMAAGVAHEIRNPLHTIRAALDVLEVRLARGEDPTAYLDVVRREIERADRTVHEILSYSRKAEAHYRKDDLVACLRESLNRINIPGTVQVVEQFEPGLPQTYLDRERLSRVFINLVENAIEAMEGRGQLRLVARRAPSLGQPGGELVVSDQGALVVEVVDNGPGIAATDLSHVFEPFFTRKSARGGTGLGLAICQRIVEEHDGTIEVASRPGNGCSFRVVLPVKDES